MNVPNYDGVEIIFNMGEFKEIKGLWWLPNASDNQISGTLNIRNDRIVLETIGSLVEDNPILHFAAGKVPQYNVIWGISSDAKEVSLFNCYESMSLNTACPFPVAKYSVQVVAIGKHIPSLDEVGNYDVKAYFDELPYWFRPNCLHFDIQEKRYTFCVDLDNANQVTVQIDDDCILRLEGETNISHDKTGMRVEVEQVSTLKFTFSNQISMRDAKQKILGFEQFLSFATLAPVKYKRFLLIDKDKQNDRTKNSTIEIYDKKESTLSKPERFWEYLFVYETIKDSFSSIIKKWYTEKNMFPIRAHLIDSVGHKGVFCSTDFLTIIQAVEGFYCRFREDGISLNKILSNLREEFKEISILEMSDPDIDYIRDSRHYYSHLLPPGKKPNVVDGHELYDLNHKLRKLLLCCILNFIGFDNNEINMIFAKSHNSYLRMISGKEREIKDKEPIIINGEILAVTQKTEVVPE